MMIRTFVFDRTEDVNGASGTWEPATGVQFPDGTVVIRWTSTTPSTVVWNSIDDALTVHSHGGKTVVRWLTSEPTPAEHDLEAIAESLRQHNAAVDVDYEQCTCGVLIEDWDLHLADVAVRAVLAGTPTALQRVAALMENDGDLRKSSTLDWHANGYFRLQVVGRDLWLAWITALHGSPDGVNAAVRVDRRSAEYPFEWHWMTPDGAVQVMYLESAQESTEEDLGGDSL